MTSPPNDAASRPTNQPPYRAATEFADAASAHSADWFASFMDNLPGLAWIKDSDGRYFYANAAAQAAFGKTPVELYGRTDAEIFPAVTAAQFSANDRAALTSPTGIQTTETLVHPDGTVHHSLVNKFQIRDGSGRSLVGGIAVDITERKQIEQALRESEARFREAANSAPAPVWMTNANGSIEFVNQAFEDFAGLDSGGLTGDVWFSFVHPEDLPTVAERRRAAWAAGYQPYSLKTRFRRADGEWRWLEVSSKPRFDHAGNFHGYVGLAVDRTNAYRAETALRESEERFRLMSENAPVMIWMSDINGRCQHLNKMLRGFWGVGEEDDLSSFDWRTTIHPDDVAHVDAGVMSALQNKVTMSARGRFRNSAGVYRVLRTEAQPRFSETGEFLGLIGVNVDVTDALTAEEALRESEARYRAVVESQSEMVCRFRADGTIVFVNGAYARSRGATTGDLEGQKLWEFILEHDRASVREMLARLTPNAPEVRIENRFNTTDGVRWMLWTNRALTFDAAGRWIEAQATGVDITDRRQAEEHKRLLLDELNHRVKNTLMTVQAIANLSLSRDVSSAEVRESFASRLLALSRVHNLLTEENWMGASLATLLAQALQPYGYSPDGKGRIRISGPRVSLSAKKAQTFAMAFHELATNAAKYGALSGEEGAIDVSWTYHGRAAEPFSLTWIETGGPAVKPPTRNGFGTIMITQILASEIAGTVAVDYDSSGLICRMSGSVAG